jgi:hypothetical protein
LELTAKGSSFDTIVHIQEHAMAEVDAVTEDAFNK